MRQAGRYLPEYKKTREQAGSFLNFDPTRPEVVRTSAVKARWTATGRGILMTAVIETFEISFRTRYLRSGSPRSGSPRSPAGTYCSKQ